MKTLILPPRYSEDSIILRKAALKVGWSVERAQGWRAPTSWAFDPSEVVFYGEPLFALTMADQLGIVLIEPDPRWLPQLPQRWLQRQVRATTVGGLRDEIEGGPWFIKPADDKCFAAKVYAHVDELHISEDIDAQTVVLISEVFDWACEYRCFVSDGQVRTGSIYAIDGQLAQDEHGQWMASKQEVEMAMSYCQSFVDACADDIPPAVVVDVGRHRDGRWAVVEANAAWGSGVYGCVPECVLDVLSSAVMPAPAPTSLSRWCRSFWGR